MGKEQRTKQDQKKLKLARKWAWIKALSSLPLMLPFFFFFAFKSCWEQNKWIWELE